MRTAPVALAFLDDPEALATAAREISSLTHFDQDSGDACVLWSLAIRHAVINGAFDVRVGLTWLPGDRRQRWVDLIDTAEQSQPRDFAHNGWVVEAFQAAWSAIFNTAVPQEAFQAGSFPAQHLQFALEAAVRGGRDTDTVAAIAGGLLGARWGVSAVPVLWQRKIHGWPGLRQRDLVRLAIEVADPRSRDRVLSYSYLRALSTPTIHPHDEGVVLGPVNAARGLPAYVDAVVSLCRVEDVHRPPGAVLPEDQIEIWLIDSPNPADNPNLGFVLSQATDAVGILRSEGKTVFLHCAAGQSRTPTVAALTGSRAKGISPKDALAEVVAALPDACVNSLFESLLTRWPCADGAELMHPAT